MTPSEKLDPRRYPYREDLAAAWLRDRIAAPAYAEATPHRVWHGRTGLWSQPDDRRPMASELVYGELFDVYDSRPDGWSWGQNSADGYVGWVRGAALQPADPSAVASHIVKTRYTLRFPTPDIKAPPLLNGHLHHLPLGAKLRIVGQEGRFWRLDDGHYVFADHTAPLASGWGLPDPVETALALRGTPYLWGGRTPLGIDCSGLVQLCLALAGHPVPRDSDMQRNEIGTPVTEEPIRRGDVIGFPGHVAFALDAETVVHATAFTLSVGVEPLAAVAERADPTRGQGILTVRRIEGIASAISAMQKSPL